MTNTAEQIENNLNDTNINRIIELATHMAEDENFGQFRFQAINEWISGSRSSTSLKQFYAGNHLQTERTQSLVVNADQPEFLAGDNTAPNAVEHYLNALASCLTTTIVAHASVQGIAIDALEITAEGEMDARGFFGISDNVNRGYNRITVAININSVADEATVRKLISYSPVYEMVSIAVPVEITISNKVH